MAQLTIPSGKLLIIKRAGQNVVNVPLPLGDDVSLDISSDFGPIINMSKNNALTALATAIPFLRDNGLSGHFLQEGFQVWQGTKPIEININIILNMKTNAKVDVLEPVISLINLGLPKLAGNKWGLIPPGPNIFEQFSSVERNEGESYLKGQGKISIRIANYISLPSVVITKAVPTYSTVTDENGHSIKCSLEIGFRSTDIAHQEMLSGMINRTSSSTESKIISDVSEVGTFGE